MKAKYSLHERIAVRAYYLAESGFSANPLQCWLEAEEHEQMLHHDRQAAARKGAATKRARTQYTPHLIVRNSA